MTAELLPLLETAVLLALGALTHSRLLVLAAALAGLGWTVWSHDLSVLMGQTPTQLVTTFGGYALGTVFGMVLAGMRPRIRTTPAPQTAYARASGASRARSGPSISWSGLMIRSLILIVGVLIAAIALYLQGDWVPQWRSTVDQWLASPTARSLGFPPPTPVPPAVSVPAPSATESKPSGAASQGAGSSRQAGGHSGRAGTPSERPRGDLRHCLERGSAQDLRQCAEAGR